jgi:hypothetical protein
MPGKGALEGAPARLAFEFHLMGGLAGLGQAAQIRCHIQPCPQACGQQSSLVIAAPPQSGRCQRHRDQYLGQLIAVMLQVIGKAIREPAQLPGLAMVLD